MSGGHFDYKDNYLNDFAETLCLDITREKDPKVRSILLSMILDLERMGNLLHAYDWWISGDTDKESFLEAVAKETPKLWWACALDDASGFVVMRSGEQRGGTFTTSKEAEEYARLLNEQEVITRVYGYRNDY